VTTDVIGRRRAVEQRLARARTLAQSLDEATADLAATAGQPLDVLDPDGSLRTALTALAGAAALRPHFDVIVALPGASFALRVQHINEEIEIEVLQRDGPDEEPEPAAEPAPEPAAEPEVPSPRAEEKPVDRNRSVERPQRTAPDAEPAHVASDLAAMLWQNVAGPDS
jgi:hypothetical protein